MGEPSLGIKYHYLYEQSLSAQGWASRERDPEAGPEGWGAEPSVEPSRWFKVRPAGWVQDQGAAIDTQW